MNRTSTPLFGEMEELPQNGSTPKGMSVEKKEEEVKLVEKNSPYPKAVFFIIGNEFCERFCYFGMRAILLLYLMDHLSWSNSAATGVYHAFIVGCCFTSILGAVLADGYIGKFRTILYLSSIYTLGSALMSLTAFPPPFWLGPVTGLILIALGTGGIKPCVSAFGGDQFKKNQEKERASFFSAFYFTINLGSFLSIVLTPIIKDGVTCFNRKCFPLAFGIPAILMVVSTSLFVIGRRWYVIKPPTGSVITDLFRCIGSALRNRCKSGSGYKQHWLNHAGPEFQTSFLNDVKRVLKVLVLYIPVPVFWALFDQQGSRWTIQSAQLDRSLNDDWYFLPEQIQAINPILILIFIPLFDMGVYPLMDKLRIPNRPLQRMVVGMMMASLSFVASGILQLKIDGTLLRLENNNSFVTFVNKAPCHLVVSGSMPEVDLPRGWTSPRMSLPSGRYNLEVDAHPGDSTACPLEVPGRFRLEPRHPECYLVVLSLAGGSGEVANDSMVTTSSSSGGNETSSRVPLPVLRADVFPYDLNKEPTGACYLRMLDVGPSRNLTGVYLRGLSSSRRYHYDMTDGRNDYIQINPGRYEVVVQDGRTSFFVRLGNGGKYSLVLGSDGNSSLTNLLVEDVDPNVVSMWLQLPQYVIITLGEVAFSVTGLWFAYSQAPVTMKSVVQAAWFLTTGFGNIIDVVIASAALIPSQAAEFFFFAVLMFVTTILFGILSSSYQYYEEAPSYEDLDSASTVAPSTDDAKPPASPSAPQSGTTTAELRPPGSYDSEDSKRPNKSPSWKREEMENANLTLAR